MFGRKKDPAKKEDATQNSESRQRVEQSEREAEENIVYFFLISLAIFGVVVIYFGIAKEFT